MVSKLISSITTHLGHSLFVSLLIIGLATSVTKIHGSIIPENLEEIARTLSSGSLASLPLEVWNLSEDLIPELMVKTAEWIETSNWLTSLSKENVTDGHREKRAVGGLRLLDWVRAYRKDPETYSCVRKIVCEILAKSSLAEQSVKSPLGGTIMSMLGRAVEHGSEMVDLVTEVVGDPDKCLNFAQNELCD